MEQTVCQQRRLSSRPGFDPSARGAHAQASQAPAVSSRAPAPGVGHELVAELQQRVQTLEREKATVTEKAKQFIAMKTQELKTRNAELEGQVSTLTQKVRSLEAGPSGAGQGNRNAELEEKLTDLTEQVRSSEAALAAANEEIRTLKSKLQEAKQEAIAASAEPSASTAEAAKVVDVTEVEFIDETVTVPVEKRVEKIVEAPKIVKETRHHHVQQDVIVEVHVPVEKEVPEATEAVPAAQDASSPLKQPDNSLED